MKKRLKGILFAFLITFPFVFVLIFLGYFSIQYDVVLNVDNVVGEGICQSYGSQVDGRTTVSAVTFYFGSELKTATIRGAYYDVDTFYLIPSDVSEFDFLSMDVYVRGIHLSHFDGGDILADGEILEGTTAKLSSVNNIVHVDIFDPAEGTTITISEEFIPLWFWILYYAIMVMIALLLAVLLDLLFAKVPKLRLPLMRAAGVAVTLLMGGFLCGSLSYMTYINFLLNWVLVFSMAILIDALTLPFLGTLITMGFITVWYIANYFVIILRGKPIMPSDLKAVGTAAEVMGGYTFMPTWKMVLGVIVVVGYSVCIVFIWRRNHLKEKQSLKRNLISRGIAIACALFLIIICINTKTFKNLDSFAWDTYLTLDFHKEGMVLSFVKNLYNSQIEKPEGYSREKIDKYLEEYQSKNKIESPKDTIHPTRVIMIMNEAFSDLRTVGLDDKIDVMPFIDSLHKNTVKGNLYVSVFGGGTCNTEFEALTGNTLAFLGVGAYPYTEYVTKPLFSLASYFESVGYVSEAFHANLPNNWNRNLVYPNLGFEDFHGIDDYVENEDVVYLHDLPADISDYKYMKDIDDENSGEPRFFFDVTMQNHSPYERWLDVEKAETVERYGSDLYVDTQIYLSLIKASDDEVKQLVETYQDSDEPTMIVFFGDHQPGLPGTAINEVYTDIRANLDMYKTRFFIWTNYDSPSMHNMGISANYLPWLILDQGNFSLPPYVQMLKEVYEHYPVFSSQGVIDDEGNVYDTTEEVMDDPLIKKYQYIQYANMFDEIDPAWFEVN